MSLPPLQDRGRLNKDTGLLRPYSIRAEVPLAARPPCAARFDPDELCLCQGGKIDRSVPLKLVDHSRIEELDVGHAALVDHITEADLELDYL